MLVVALALVVALVVVSLAFAGVVRSLIRQHARREDLLVNQVCALSGRPWQPAPASERHERPEPVEELVDPSHWVEL